MKQIFRYIVVYVLLTVSAVYSQAAPVTVKAKLDSVQILMGNMTTLRMEVVENRNSKGRFAMFESNIPDGVIGVCNDSVELRTSFKRDTLDLGSGRIQINYEIPVQAFDSGMYRLPAFEYIVGRDTACSNRVTLKVIPVSVTADAQISGYADIVPPAESSWTDNLPDFLYYYWWLILLIIALIAVAIYLVMKFRKDGVVIRRKPEPNPWNVAMGKLENLKQRKLWEQGMEREYFTELTEILRVYLDKRFGINAMEMTTRQILDTLKANPEIGDKKEYMRQVLDMADFVKFAAIKTLPADNVASYENAVKFLEETKPVEQKPQKIDDGFEIDEEPDEKGGDA